MTKQDAVVQAIRRSLAHHQPGEFTIEVLDQGIERVEGWWYVSVRADRQPQKRYQYYEVLGDVEDELWKTKKLNVLLIPTMNGGKNLGAKRSGRKVGKQSVGGKERAAIHRRKPA